MHSGIFRRGTKTFFIFKLLLWGAILGSVSSSPRNLVAAEKQAVAWRFVGGRPYISVQDLMVHFGVPTFFDQRRSRLLIEGEGKLAFFVPRGSFAVVDGRFQRFGQPLIEEEGQLYLEGAVVQSHLLGFVAPALRDTVKEEVRSAFSRLNTAVCATDRPVKKIFVDPGHGGDDKGAVRFGIKEKDLVLNFSKRVVAELKSRGFEVMVSRSRDEFIALDLRPELARTWGADAFISIHANTSQFPGARGTETYILSSDATDAEARKLAVSENELIQHLRPGKGAGDVTLNSILWDVGQTAYLQDSAYLASDVHSQLLSSANDFFEKKGKDKRWKNRGVREAPFVVLSRAAMPAILVELAYLSNVEDRVLLTQLDFQKALAKALVDGVQKFADHCSPKRGNSP